MPLEQLLPTSSVSYPLCPQEPFPPREGKNDFASSRRSGSSENRHFVSPRLPPPCSPRTSRDAKADFPLWSGTRHSQNLHQALFHRLGFWIESVQLVGGQQEWVLCEGQRMPEFLIEGNWKWALRSHWLVFSSCTKRVCGNHVLCCTQQAMERFIRGSYALYMCSFRQVKRNKVCVHLNDFFRTSFANMTSNFHFNAGKIVTVLESFIEMWQNVTTRLPEHFKWMARIKSLHFSILSFSFCLYVCLSYRAAYVLGSQRECYPYVSLLLLPIY